MQTQLRQSVIVFQHFAYNRDDANSNNDTMVKYQYRNHNILRDKVSKGDDCHAGNEIMLS